MNHSTLVSNLAKPGPDILSTITPTQCELLHMGLGLSGEVGEIVDTLKKHIIYEQPLNRPNLIEELGDLEFFLERLRQLLGIDRAETIGHNISKLSQRYASGTYTNTHAKQRLDKVDPSCP